jgi:type VI secretion system secreted protein VgrG
MTTPAQPAPYARTFSLEFPGQSPSGVTVIRFEGEEHLSRPYRFVIDFAAKDADLDGLIHKSAVFTIAGAATGRKTVYRGVVVEIEQTARVMGWQLYRIVLMPAMIALARQIQSEIYIDGRHIPEVIQQIFTNALLTPVLRPIPAKWPDQPLPFICQYEESLLDFATRLMEREGLYYFFEEENGAESVVIACGKSAHKTGGAPYVYHEAGMQDETYDESAIPMLSMRRQMLPRRVVLKSYNYQKSSLGLLEESATVKADGVGEIVLADEYYPSASEGKRLAGMRAEALLCRERLFTAESAAVGLRAGGLFRLAGHYRADFNQEYLVIAGTHQGRQPATYLSDLGITLADDPGRKGYWNRLELIPSALQYRSERLTPRPRIGGTVTAVVDGEGSGQYAVLNAEGEYKVRFPTLGKQRPAGKGSCWIRMASPYGGEDHGMHFPLLKGTEVMVAFRDGDPDQPFISGTIPNSTHQSVVKDLNLFANLLRTAGGNRLTLGDEKDKTHATLETAKGNRLQMNDDADDPGIDLETASKQQWVSLKDEGSSGEVVMAAATPLAALGVSGNIPGFYDQSKVRVGRAVSGIELATNHSVNRITQVADSSISLGNHSKVAVGVMSAVALGMNSTVAGGPHSRDLLWGGSEFSASEITRFCGGDYININGKTLIGGEKDVVIGGGFLPPMEAPYRALKTAFLVSLALSVAGTAAGCTAGILHSSLEKKMAVTGVTIATALVMWKIKKVYFTALKTAPPQIGYGGLLELNLLGVQLSANPAGGRLRLNPFGATLASDMAGINSFTATTSGIGVKGLTVVASAMTAMQLEAKTAMLVKTPGAFSIQGGALGAVKVGTSNLTLTPAAAQLVSGGIIKIG